MKIVPCAACGGKVSTQADACPHCGHPQRAGRQSPTNRGGPSCYSCSNEATTRCVSCGTFSCPSHLESIWVQYGKSGGNYELRCTQCVSSYQTWRAIGCIFSIIVLIVGAIIFFSVINNQ